MTRRPPAVRSRRRAILACVCALSLLAGCGALGLGSGRSAAERTVAQAVELSQAGSTREAIDLVERELGSATRPEVAYLRAFTLAWLHEELPRERGEEDAREQHLQSAVEHYRAALALQPGRPDASANLALLLNRIGQDERRAGGPGAIERCEARLQEALSVLESVSIELEAPEETYRRRVAIGNTWRDLAVVREAFDAESFARALSEYRAAMALPVEDDLAQLAIVAARVLQGERAGGTEWARLLEAECREFARNDAPEAALRGYEVLARNDPAERILEAWLKLEAAANTFSTASLERLPAPGAWDERRELVVELYRLAEDPERAAELTLWNASAPRRHVLALLLQSMGAVRAVAGNVAGAAELYEVALRVAPGPAEYGDEGPLLGEDLVGLDVALDQLLLVQGHAADVDPAGDRLQFVLDHEFFARETLDDIEQLDLEGTQRLHTVLGLILADRGAWDAGPWEDPWRTAPAHLREAARVALENPAVPRGPNEKPLPDLSAVLAEGLSPTDRRPSEALDAYLDAALGYHDLGDASLAEENFEKAEVLAASLSARSRRELGDVEDILGIHRGGFLPRKWLPVGWYVGGAATLSYHTQTSGDIDDDLAALGNTTQTSFDGDDLGGRIYVGYQFEEPVALEFGFLGMGDSESTITATGVTNLAQLASDVDDVHPFLADGFTLGARVNLWGAGPFTLTGRVGAWAWDATKEALVSTNIGSVTTRSSERGFDLFFGAGAVLGEWRSFHATIDYERYYLDGDGVDTFSFGLQYSLGR